MCQLTTILQRSTPADHAQEVPHVHQSAPHDPVCHGNRTRPRHLRSHLLSLHARRERRFLVRGRVDRRFLYPPQRLLAEARPRS